jgi:hypothetical protein
MNRIARAVCVAVLALAAFPPIASAHGGNPDYRSVIDSVHPKVPGVKFQVLDYDSYFQLTDHGNHTVVIYGYEHEPYARILPNGTVQVNHRSPAAYLNEERFGGVTVPKSANPKDPPQWKTIDKTGTFTWHDHRMHYMARNTPQQVTDTHKKTKIFNYKVPLSVDSKRGAIDGTLFWVGPADTSKLPFLIIGAVIVIGSIALVLFVRRRRRNEPQKPDPKADSAKETREAW